MTNSQNQPRKLGLFLPPLLQLILSIIGLSISLLTGGLGILGGVFGLIETNLSVDQQSFFSSGWALLLIAGLFILPLLQSVQQLTGKATHFSEIRPFRLATILMVLWVPLMLFGKLFEKSDILQWLALPPLKILLIVIPIFFFMEIGRRDLRYPEGGAAGIYSLGVVIGQPLVLLLESVLLIVVVLVGVGWLSTTQPSILNEFSRLGQRLMDMQMDSQMAQEALLPYLQNPVVVIVVMTVFAGLIPLLEEFLKPLAIWVMVGRKLDEQAGFVLGLFAGGTFGLLESLGMAVSSSAQGWSSIIVARLGTGVLHVTTTALMGWGLAAAWKNKKYLRLGLTFMIAVTLHAVWNFLGVYSGIQQFISIDENSTQSIIALIGLVVMGIGMFITLWVVNRHLQKQQAEQYFSDIPMQPVTIIQSNGNADEFTENN